MKLIRRPLNFQVRQIGNPEDRILEFVGSTAAVDRYGDVIEVAGWQLNNYMKNARFLWSHNYSMPPLGTALSVKKTADALVFQIKFASPEEYGGEWPANMPTPGTIYNLYCSGHLNATSVGFQGLEAEPILGKADDQGYRPRTGTRYIKQELYELSAVTVPANPEALIVNAVQKGIISEEEGQRFREACADPPALE